MPNFINCVTAKMRLWVAPLTTYALVKASQAWELALVQPLADLGQVIIAQWGDGLGWVIYVSIIGGLIGGPAGLAALSTIACTMWTIKRLSS